MSSVASSPTNLSPRDNSSSYFAEVFSETRRVLQAASQRANVVRENVANWLRSSPPVVPDLEAGRVKVLDPNSCGSCEGCFRGIKEGARTTAEVAKELKELFAFVAVGGTLFGLSALCGKALESIGFTPDFNTSRPPYCCGLAP